jgi:hypothetical protein
MVETIPQITRDVLPHRTTKKEHTEHFELNNTLLLHKSSVPYKHNHELYMLK